MKNFLAAPSLALGLALWLAASLASSAAAMEVAGIKFDDSAKVGAGDTAPAVLNGAGIRGVLFFKAYVIALYLPQKADTLANVLATVGPRRIHIVALRDLTAGQFADALVKGIRKNHSEAELAALNPRLETFRTTLLALKHAPKGTVIHLDWLPVAEGGATRLVVNGKQAGTLVPGEDFYHALLRIWLGEKPADGALKNALLGKAK